MQKNVILLVIDCLRPDYLNQGFSPTIDSLSKTGMTFSNCFANGPFSPASYVSIITSRTSLEFNSISKYPDQAISLAEVLQSNSHTTACFNTNAWVSSYFGYDRGFDTFKDFFINSSEAKKRNIFGKIDKWLQKKFNQNSLLMHSLRKAEYFKNLLMSKKIERKEADVVFGELKKWIEKNKENSFFAWTILMDVHPPYYPPGEFLQKLKIDIPESKKKWVNACLASQLKGEDLEVLKSLYKASILYTDTKVKELVDFLKEIKIYDNTILIITADHGYEFMEHGWIGMKAKMYEENIKVPLIFTNTGMGVNESMVSLQDLPLTILNLLNIQSEDFNGRNIINTKTDEVIHTECAYNSVLGPLYVGEESQYSKNKVYSIRTKEWKYIRDFGKEKEELYNLTNDPLEKNNIQNKAMLAKFRQMLDRRIEQQKNNLKQAELKGAIDTIKF